MSESVGWLKSALADRYHIERELGAGGMAAVYLAEDLKHHRNVAIGVLHAELSTVLGTERFLKQIKRTANLQHPLWATDPRSSDTAGWSNRLSHDGGIINVQGPEQVSAPYLRVVPNWVTPMEGAVNKANP